MSSNPSLIILLVALLALACNGQQAQQLLLEPGEPLMASESVPAKLAAPAVGQASAIKQVLNELVTNAYQLGQASKTYLDIQPEFTQAWADFPYAPGYLSAGYRQSHTPYQQQQSQYKAQGGVPSPNSVGFGYVDWTGPVNPASLYTPVSLPYYYRVPPQAVFYLPQRAIYQQIARPAYQPVAKPAYQSAAKPIY